MPANAKIKQQRRSCDVGRAPAWSAIRRLSLSMKNAPPMATSSSGRSFATVAMEFSRAPSVTPRRLTRDQNANAATRMAISMPRPASGGTSSPRLDANTVDDRRGRKRAQHPQQHAGHEADVRSERGADIGVRPAGERHAAAGIRDAEHDEAHRDGADEIRDRCGRAERAGHVGRQTEDAAADRDVDDGRGQSQRADRTDERLALTCFWKHDGRLPGAREPKCYRVRECGYSQRPPGLLVP